jgi:hypothetical protein
MTLLTIAQTVAPYIGIPKPITVLDDNPNTLKIATYANDIGCDLSRRFDWASLNKTATVNGNGSASRLPMPIDFSRLSAGFSVIHNGSPVRGGLSSDEWISLDFTAGEPRYFRIFGNEIELYPYLSNADSVNVSYQSKNWVKGDKSKMSLDGDESILPERLIIAGVVWMFKRSAGEPFEDYMAQYEAMFADLSQQENMDR